MMRQEEVDFHAALDQRLSEIQHHANRLAYAKEARKDADASDLASFWARGWKVADRWPRAGNVNSRP